MFCGSAPGNDPRFVEYATALGTALAQTGHELVYGGGRTGLMGALADAAVAAGGPVIGIIPQQLEDREVAHRGISDLRIVGSMHERKALMAELSDGFIALPGGFGTLEEFCEAVTWVQLGIQRKPCLLANLAGYFDPLVEQFDRGEASGFISPANRAIVRVVTSVSALLAIVSRNTATERILP
ncbi:MAG TPA: TIGR00730 family Rossman fold protein [Candidatus Lustribacter sp.]